MPATSILFGRLLILLGIIGYGYGMYAGNSSLTALIPSGFGLILMITGHLSNAKENLRKHLMHAAVLVGLAGFLMTAFRLLSKISDLSFSAAVISQTLMSLLCLSFVILSIRSFIKARQAS